MNCIIMYLYHNYNDIVEKELIAMLFKPHCLSRTTLSKEELVKDRKNCRKFGPCVLAKRLYILIAFILTGDIIFHCPMLKEYLRELL